MHIGWETTLAEKGLHIPSQTPKFLEKLKMIINDTNPTQLILLGDIKHTVSKIGATEWRDIPTFFEALLDLVGNVSVIPGNHDGNLKGLTPREINLLPITGLAINNEIGFIHGHAWPKPEVLGCDNIVMGHLHPMIKLTDALGISTTHQVWLRASSNSKLLVKGFLKHLGIKEENNCNETMKKLFNVNITNPFCIFIPTFNNFLGGQILNRNLMNGNSKESYIGPLLRTGGIEIRNANVHLLDGTYLGKLNKIPSSEI